ncbi:MAG: PEP-CTERM sorting domain-containing protein [Hyphomicrobiaceae bacterium]|nr:PEP-CTERM sorting domain-containing protein [Hyphomicrobiaceae bacterium]
MRIVLFVLTVLALSFPAAGPANSEIYNVNVSTLPTIAGSGGKFFWACSGAACSNLIYGTQSPTYDLSDLDIPTGATIFLGSLDLYAAGYSNQYGDSGYFNPVYSVQTASDASALSRLGTLPAGPGPVCNRSNPNCHFTFPAPLHVDLYIEYAPYVSIRYSQGTFTAAAAVPEPSTWAMLLVGLAGVGYFGYRRRNQGAALKAA